MAFWLRGGHLAASCQSRCYRRNLGWGWSTFRSRSPSRLLASQARSRIQFGADFRSKSLRLKTHFTGRVVYQINHQAFQHLEASYPAPSQQLFYPLFLTGHFYHAQMRWSQRNHPVFSCSYCSIWYWFLPMTAPSASLVALRRNYHHSYFLFFLIKK